MKKWVGLLRGVNVGGHNKVPMADLRMASAAAGWMDVQSYIASGNLVFSADGSATELAKKLDAILVRNFAVNTRSLVLDGATFLTAHAECPFPQDAGKMVHGLFCHNAPIIDADAYAALRVPSEQVIAKDTVVWLFAPDGVGRSRLFAKIDKVVTGTTHTARNLNTIAKLAEMLDG